MKVYANENFSTLFYERNRKLSPTLKGTWESAKRIGYHRIFYTLLMCFSSWVFSSSAYKQSCTCHKHINTDIYFCQLLSNVDFQQWERWDWDFTDCGRCTQITTKRQQHGFSSILIGRFSIIGNRKIVNS